MAGHSKWAQIKHKKAITDAKKGRIFSKFVQEITVAAGSGAADPVMNPRLRAAIERARAGGLPKDNIDRAVAKASGTGEGGGLKEFLYEAAAGSGVSILIEGISDNTNRSHNEVRHILNEHGGRMAEPGSLAWNFDKIGVLHLTKEDNPNQSPEDIELTIIDAGASDFTAAHDSWLIETPFIERDRIRAALEAKGTATCFAGHDYKPRSTVSLDPETQKRTETLLDALMEHNDVQEVYTNLAE